MLQKSPNVFFSASEKLLCLNMTLHCMHAVTEQQQTLIVFGWGVTQEYLPIFGRRSEHTEKPKQNTIGGKRKKLVIF